MKKIVFLLFLCILTAAVFTACAHNHSWVEASCETPKYCADCGEVEGDILGHTWMDATCEKPKTCQVCGMIEGTALGHSWGEASCETPKTCSVCHKTTGSVLAHRWQDATTEAPMTCVDCGATEGERILTDERFHTDSCKDLFGTWGGVFGARELKISFDNRGNISVRNITSENYLMVRENITGVYYVDGDRIYGNTGWDLPMQIVSYQLEGNVLTVTAEGRTMRLYKFTTGQTEYTDPRYNAEDAKAVWGTWEFKANFQNQNIQAKVIFDDKGNVYAYGAFGNQTMCKKGKYYIDGSNICGDLNWSENMQSLQFTLQDNTVTAVIQGIPLQLLKTSSSMADPFQAETSEKFDKEACKAFIGTWKGTSNGSQITVTFTDTGKLQMLTNVRDGITMEMELVYYMQLQWLNVSQNWFDLPTEVPYTLEGNQLTITIAGQTVVLTKQA